MNIVDNQNIYLGIDGYPVPKDYISKFMLVPGIDYRIKNKNIEDSYFDTVGLIIRGDNTLIIFPKNYFSETDLTYKPLSYEQKNLLKDDFTLLFNVIGKYIQNRAICSNKYFGEIPNFKSDYPFKNFFSIYDYYNTYGLYKNINKELNTSHGKLNWKKTIQKSNKFISNDSLIHYPLFYNRDLQHDNFLTHTMCYIINYTLKRFDFLLKLTNCVQLEFSFDYLNNMNYVIKKLSIKLGQTQKDIDRILITNMISFFKKLNLNKGDGGDVNIKINFFNLVWEEMVGDYLNNNFTDFIKNSKIFPYFEDKKNKSWNFQKRSFIIDSSTNNFRIIPDYYFVDKQVQFIFDAKYYKSINKIDFKQLTYHYILKNSNILINKQKTYSVLFLPTYKSDFSTTHFKVNEAFLSEATEDLTISLYFLNIKNIMLLYQ